MKIPGRPYVCTVSPCQQYSIERRICSFKVRWLDTQVKRKQLDDESEIDKSDFVTD
jgi:hypothetical protein